MTVTRFAPSPTGYLHIGNLRTALFNYLIAQQAGGQFILRLDDTDPERSKDEYADAIMADLDWLGLGWDRVEKQSTRLDRYRAVADELRAAGRLYECFETPVELDLKRKKQLNMGKPPVYDRAGLGLSDAEKERLRADRGAGHWRFKLDHARIEWTDGILGDLSLDAASVSDPVLIRGDGQFLYTLASVCDDIDFAITHVVRGSDHVTNTATQVQIIRALGADVPEFAHHSLLTGPQGEALSKRLGVLALRDLRAQGIEPMAMLSHLARLGSSDPVELRASMGELVAGFDIARFGSAPTKFDEAALLPLTARYLAGLPLEAVAGDVDALGVPGDLAEKFWHTVRENITVLADMENWWKLFRDGPDDDFIMAVDKDFEFVKDAISMLPTHPYGPKTWIEWTAKVQEKTGRKGRSLYMPLRIALTGSPRGPEMAGVMPLLQKVPRTPKEKNV